MKLPYQKKSKTSYAAADQALPKARTQRIKVLSAIIRAGKTGLSDDEISRELRIPRSSTCARRNGLELDGLIRDSGKTRLSRYKRACSVWVSTAAGKAAV